MKVSMQMPVTLPVDAALEIVATDAVPRDRWYLITGKLSPAGADEVRLRVKAGELEPAVLAEVLVREGKAVAGTVRL
jgi:hypothetical protein